MCQTLARHMLQKAELPSSQALHGRCIEVGAAHGKGGKGEEPGLIISLVRRKFPLAFIRAFCRLKVSEILYYIILYYIILYHIT